MRRVFLLSALFPIFAYAVDSDVTAQNLIDAATTSKINSLVISNSESGFIKPIPWGSAENASCDLLYSADCVSALNSNKSSSANKQVTIKHSEEAYNGANDSYFNPTSNKYDQNAIATFNITNSNQTALQSYSTTLNNTSSPTTENLLKQNVTIPFKATNSTLVNVGASKVEFNITY